MAEARSLPHSLKYRLLRRLEALHSLELEEKAKICQQLCKMYANISPRSPEESVFFLDRDAYNFAKEVLSNEALLTKVSPIVACHLLRYATGIVFEEGAQSELISFYQKFNQSLTLSNPNAFDRCFEELKRNQFQTILFELASLGPFSDAVNASIARKLAELPPQERVNVLLHWEENFPETLKILLPVFCKTKIFSDISDSMLGLFCSNKKEYPIDRLFSQAFVKNDELRERILTYYPSAGIPDDYQSLSVQLCLTQSALERESLDKHKTADYFRILSRIQSDSPPLSGAFLRRLTPEIVDFLHLPLKMKVLVMNALGSLDVWFTIKEWVEVVMIVGFSGDFFNHDAREAKERIEQLKSCHFSDDFWLEYLTKDDAPGPGNWTALLYNKILTHYRLFKIVVAAGKVSTLLRQPDLEGEFYRIGEKGLMELALGTSTVHMQETLRFQAMLTLFSPFDWSEELFKWFVQDYGLASHVENLSLHVQAKSHEVYTEAFLESMLAVQEVKTKNQAKFLMHCFAQDNYCVLRSELSQGIAPVSSVAEDDEVDIESDLVGGVATRVAVSARVQGNPVSIGQQHKWARFGRLVARQCIVANPSVVGTLPYEKGLSFDPRFVRVLAKQFALMGLSSEDPRTKVIHAFSKALMKTLYGICETLEQVEALREMLIAYRRETCSLFFEGSHKTEVTKAMWDKVKSNAGFTAFVGAHDEIGIVRTLARRRKEVLGDEACHRVSQAGVSSQSSGGVLYSFPDDDQTSIFGGAGDATPADDEAGAVADLSSVRSDSPPYSAMKKVKSTETVVFADGAGAGGVVEGGGEVKSEGGAKRPSGLLAFWKKTPAKLPREGVRKDAHEQQLVTRSAGTIAGDNRAGILEKVVAGKEYYARLEGCLIKMESHLFMPEDSVALYDFLESGLSSQLDLFHFREKILTDHDLAVMVGPSVVSFLLDVEEISETPRPDTHFVSQCRALNKLCQNEYAADEEILSQVVGFSHETISPMLLRNGKVEVFCTMLANTEDFKSCIRLLNILDKYTEFLTRDVIEAVVATFIFMDVKIEELIQAFCTIENNAAWFLHAIFQHPNFTEKFNVYFAEKDNQLKYLKEEDPQLWPLALKYHEQVLVREPENPHSILIVLSLYAQYEEAVSLECLERMRPSVQKLVAFYKNTPKSNSHKDFMLRCLSMLVFWEINIQDFTSLIAESFPRAFHSTLYGSGRRIDCVFMKKFLKGLTNPSYVFSMIQGLVENNLASPIEMWNFLVEEYGLPSFSDADLNSSLFYNLYNNARRMAALIDDQRTQESFDTLSWMDATHFLCSGKKGFYDAVSGSGIGLQYDSSGAPRYYIRSLYWLHAVVLFQDNSSIRNPFTLEFFTRLFSIKSKGSYGLANILALICTLNPSQLLLCAEGADVAGDAPIVDRWKMLGELFTTHAIFENGRHVKVESCAHGLLREFAEVMTHVQSKIPMNESQFANIQAFHKGLVTHLLSRCDSPEAVICLLPHLVSCRRQFPKLYENDHNSKVIFSGMKALLPRTAGEAPVAKASFFSVKRLTDKVQAVQEARRAADGLYDLAARRLEELGVDQKAGRAMLVGAIEAGNAMSVEQEAVDAGSESGVGSLEAGSGGLAGGSMFDGGGAAAAGAGVEPTEHRGCL
jgi:hypothetical protein